MAVLIPPARACHLELREADRQGDQPVIEEIQVLEVDQAAEVRRQLLQLVLTEVQLHQVCEATEIRLGRKRSGRLGPGISSLLQWNYPAHLEDSALCPGAPSTALFSSAQQSVPA